MTKCEVAWGGRNGKKGISIVLALEKGGEPFAVHRSHYSGPVRKLYTLSPNGDAAEWENLADFAARGFVRFVRNVNALASVRSARS